MIPEQDDRNTFQPTQTPYQSEQKTRIQDEDEAIYIAEVDGEFVAITKFNETGEQTIELAAVTSSQPTKSDLEYLRTYEEHQYESPRSSNISLMIGMGLGIVLTIGGIRLFSPPPTANNGSTAPDISQTVTPKQTVTVTTVETDRIQRTLKIRGTVAAYELIPVKSTAMGLNIQEILVDRGDYVRKGQVLVRLDNDILQAELIQAQAAVKEAKARLAELKAGSRPEEIAQAKQRVVSATAKVSQAESDLALIQKRVARNKSLQAQGAISLDSLDEVINRERVSQSNLEQARANLELERQALSRLQTGTRPEIIAQSQAALAQAQAQVQSIETKLEDTAIVAPATGTIAERNAKLGDLTSAATNLFTIIEKGRLELRIKLPETLLGQVNTNQTVKITSDANPDVELKGKVRSIDPVLAEDIPQATVKVDLPQGTNLKPGMFLDAAITTATTQGQTVPIDALLPQPEGSAIAYLVRADNIVQAQSVTMGDILPDRQVEVVSGLQPGDRIVVKGAAYLKDGDSVVVVE